MPSTAEVPTRAPSTPPGVAGWFIGPTMLLGTTSAILLVARGPDRAFVVAAALLFAVSLAWILVGVFWPAAPDRLCSECGREELTRLDPASTRGVSCAQCGSVDAERSSFLFAEAEDVAIEPLVTLERARGSGSGR